jgi:3D (Asp-Asp-Asp) domain-containing protein
MNKLKLFLALIISVAFCTTVEVLHKQNHDLVRQVHQQQQELNLTHTQLQQVQSRLAVAEGKLGYLAKNQTPVQVTAYTKVSSPSSHFADGRSVDHAYAVPHHTLPDNAVVYVALSPTAQSHLHAHIHDYIVLIHKHTHQHVIARFVDLMPSESRPVVDVFFADQKQALLWGRRADYYAVNISSLNSPFRGSIRE